MQKQIIEGSEKRGEGEREYYPLEQIDEDIANKTFEKIIEDVANEKYRNEDHTKIAIRLIDAGKGKYVAQCLQNFKDLSSEVAIRLIDAGNCYSVAEDLQNFKDLDHNDIAIHLIDARKGHCVACNLQNFKYLDHNDIAIRFIDAGKGYFFDRYLQNFKDLSSEVAIRLIDAGEGNYVAYHLQNFKDLDHNDIAIRLIDAGKGHYVAYNLQNFKDLDHNDIAIRLIDAGKGYPVAEDLQNFKDLDHNDIAIRLIDAGEGKYVARYLQNFKDLDHNDIAIRLIDAGESYFFDQYLQNFKDLSSEVAIRLIDAGKSYFFDRYLQNFKDLDYNDIAIRLIDAGKGKYVARYLQNFKDLDHNDIAIRLIDAGESYSFDRYLQNFKDLSSEVAIRLIDAGKGHSVAEDLQNFKDLNHNDIAIRLIDAGKGKYVARNLQKFKHLSNAVALKLAEEGCAYEVLEDDDCFVDLNYREIVIIGLQFNNLVTRYYNETQWGIPKEEMRRLIYQYNPYYLDDVEECMVEDVSGDELFTKQDLEVISSRPLKPSEQIILLGDRLLDSEATLPEDPEEIFRMLKEKHKEWQDEENVSKPFKQGAEVFGYKRMFQYIGTYNRHDVLHQFGSILRLYEQSTIPNEKFFANILQQVAMDTASYVQRDASEIDEDTWDEEEGEEGEIDEDTWDEEEGEEGEIDARSYLNTIAFNLQNEDLEESFKKVRKLQDALSEDDQEVHFETIQDIFSSWAHLRKFSEMRDLSKKEELVERFLAFKYAKPNLYRFATKLILHPNISTRAVEEFVFHPESFFERDDAHSMQSGHEHKKPSNYTDIPGIDLSAENLRDALIEGVYDDIAVFPEAEYVYRLPKAQYGSFQELFQDALGKRVETAITQENIAKKAKNSQETLSRLEKLLKEEHAGTLDGFFESPQRITGELRQKIDEILFDKGMGMSRYERTKGKAEDPKKLFAQLQVLLQKEGISVQDIAQGRKGVPMSLQRSVYEGVFESSLGMKREEEVYRVKISRKDDPDGLVAGNDTASCMPFGAGKQNIYMFNPMCKQLLVQKKVGDTWRTVAQSVLTEDIDVGKRVPQIIEDFEEGRLMEDIFSQELLSQGERFLVCDNIEQNRNNSLSTSERIKVLMRNALAFYTQQLPQQFNREKALVGSNCTTIVLDGSLPNTYVPVSPTAYSDNSDEHSLYFDLSHQPEQLFIQETSQFQESPRPQEKGNTSVKGINFLTFRDALGTGHIKGKAYKGATLREELFAMQNGLIAKDVNNVQKGRPNMSFKYIDDKGDMRGYLFAYETPEGVYVADLASDPETKIAGGKLMREFIYQYIQNYASKGVDKPIIAQARDTTFFPIIQKQIDRLNASKSSSYTFTLYEGETYYRGEDLMHSIQIEVEKK